MAKRKAGKGLVVKGGSTAPSIPTSSKGQAESGAAAEAVEAVEAPAEQPVAAAAAPSGGRRKKKRRVAGGAQNSATQVEAAADSDDEGGDAAAATGPGASAPAPPPGATAPPSVLAWLLWPVSPEVFFSEYWEKKPLHVRRARSDYYDGLLSKADVDRMLRAEGAVFPYGGKLNLLRYDAQGACRVDLNGPKGTLATFDDVEAAWASGATVQVMHAQQFHAPAWQLLASLERAFGSLFGANSYLTPAGQQGLAPHYDDVEVFLLQLEGSQDWRLHMPPASEEHPLPRDYSRDFKPSELEELLLECRAERGDLVYLPRGTVFAGVAAGKPGAAGFSHHITASTYYRTAWFHFLEKAVSSALEQAAVTSPEFRAGLPVNFTDFMGTWHDCGEGTSAGAANRRAAFGRSFRGLLRRLEEFVDLDATVDEMSVDFMAQRLPPCLAERKLEAASANAISLETRLRWLDASAVRAMVNPDPETSEPTVLLFHSRSNSRDKHMCVDTEAEEDVGCLRFDAAMFLPAIRVLCRSADFVRCGDLPLKNEDDRVALCQNLHTAGLLELAASN